MMYDLPQSVEVGGNEYEVRSDYRAILDICIALTDPDLTDSDRGVVALNIFYVDFEAIPPEDYEEAVKKCFWFINCGDEAQNRKAPKLMDWEQDFRYIVAPINRVLGTEVRSVPYLHWWSFISAYYEIGDCTFAQIVRIRDKKARGKKLEKAERDWYRQNRELVDLKVRYSDAEEALLKEWISPTKT